MTGRGFSLSFETPKSDPALFRHGERAYDHLLILPTKFKALGPALTPQIILDFMKKEGNVLLALSSGTTTPATLTALLQELDIQLPAERDGLVVDHFNFDAQSASEKHDVLLVPRPGPIRPGVKNYFGGEGLLAVPRAIGQTLGNGSPLLASVLSAPATAYSYNPSEETDAVEDPFATGKQLSLATAFQSRNSARFVVLGSAFKELGVLKVGKLQHFLSEGSDSSSSNGTEVATSELNPKIYRIKNEAVSLLDIDPSSTAITNRIHRLTPSSFPSTPLIPGFHMYRRHPTRCSLSFRCFLPTTVSLFRPFPRALQATRLCLRLHSFCPTSTASSTSASTTSGRFSPTLMRSAQSRCATLHTTNGLAVLQSAVPGSGSWASG
jgi:hypothetical protein